MANIKDENSTIEYYNQNSDVYINGTFNVNMNHLYNEFEKYLSIGDSILDVGCGSGRDSKYFLQKKYKVISIDASREMCERAKLITNNEVIQMKAENINFEDEFQAIWACASLLHVSKNKMLKTMVKIMAALKDNGIFYGSWKYGTAERHFKGRYFMDYTEKTLQELLSEIDNISVLKLWITSDVRSERDKEKWINVILKKSNKTK